MRVWPGNRICQLGFTLIELVIVVVVLGLLSALVLPNFSSFTGDAKQSAVDSVAAAAAAAQANNAARCKGGLSFVPVGDCVSIPLTDRNGVTLSGTAPSCVASRAGATDRPFTVVPSVSAATC